MSFAGVKMRVTDSANGLKPAASQDPAPATSGSEKVGTIEGLLHSPSKRLEQYFRATLLVLCFFTSAVCLHIQQWLGGPLYWFNQRWYYSWQAVVKESTALLLLGLNQWRTPTRAQISSDSSIKRQIRKTPSGKVIFDFPDRLVLIANHQIYTDWVFLWWSAYAARHHGHFFVVLKDSFKKIPLIGAGMMFFSWIFLSRHWEADRPRIQHRLSRLSDPKIRAPMWLLIFPEGTNMSANTHNISKKWASKSGVPDLELILLPRSRGLQFCLEELANSVDWMYDCTIAYDDVPPREYAQDIYNLKSLYLDGRNAPLAHIHWRRFAVKDIPSRDSEAFDQWLYERWAEKSKLLKCFQQYGYFPTDDAYIQADIELHNPMETLQIFASVFAVLAAWWIIKYVYWAITSLPRPGKQ